jgi:hypothetical protein
MRSWVQAGGLVSSRCKRQQFALISSDSGPPVLQIPQVCVLQPPGIEVPGDRAYRRFGGTWRSECPVTARDSSSAFVPVGLPCDRRLWQEVQGGGVLGADDGEVAPVQGGHVG